MCNGIDNWSILVLAWTQAYLLSDPCWSSTYRPGPASQILGSFGRGPWASGRHCSMGQGAGLKGISCFLRAHRSAEEKRETGQSKHWTFGKQIEFIIQFSGRIQKSKTKQRLTAVESLALTFPSSTGRISAFLLEWYLLSCLLTSGSIPCIGPENLPTLFTGSGIEGRNFSWLPSPVLLATRLESVDKLDLVEIVLEWSSSFGALLSPYAWTSGPEYEARFWWCSPWSFLGSLEPRGSLGGPTRNPETVFSCWEQNASSRFLETE